MSAELSTAGYAKSPFDWYVEEQWVTQALIEAADQHYLDGGPSSSWERVWDPCAGSGNVLKAFSSAALGKGGWASDIEFRGYDPRKPLFTQIDFLAPMKVLKPYAPRGKFSIVSNPPFSYKKGIAEAIIRRALALATNKVAMLLPIKYLASQGRYALFNDHPPRTIYILCKRPSMPPGALIAELGDKAFARGKMDFMWVLWDVEKPTLPGQTRTVWIAP